MHECLEPSSLGQFFVLVVSTLAWDALFGHTQEGSAVGKVISLVRRLLNQTPKEAIMTPENPAPAYNPYDLGELVGELKSKGLDVAEAGAKAMIESVFTWIEKSAKASTIPYDDLALIVLPKVKDFALAEADKINGHQG
jgi:hypothetical protein